MTIETITDLIHEYVYDRLNEANNSNDGKEIQHIQERQYKRKWSDKSSYERPRKKTDSQKTKYKEIEVENAAHQTGQECTTAWQNPLHVVIAKEGDITRRCADHWRKYNTSKESHHQQKETIGITTKFKKQDARWGAGYFPPRTVLQLHKFEAQE